jgi:hypothetical protein
MRGMAALASLAADVSTRHAGPLTLAAVLAVLGAGALLPYAIRHGAHIGGGLAAMSAGPALAWSGLSTKFVVVPVGVAPLLTPERCGHGLPSGAGTLLALAVVLGGGVTLLRSDAFPAAIESSVETATGVSPRADKSAATAASSAPAPGSDPWTVTTTTSPDRTPGGG